MDPLYPAAVSVIALLVYFSTAAIVGRLRVKYQVFPPATSGPDAFQRGFRVQQNTMEYLIIFLPAMWLYAWSVSPEWASGLGLIWVLGRIAYIVGYLKEAKNRMPGFITSMAALAVLLIGSLIGVGRLLIA